ncbi:VOC family protein [Metabacillus sp. KUDC1714]|uniref:PhnB-like domain-containing protein n=1 Tax=Metabacillus litoralis TaxID=152268 RepID=A0A179T8Q8_9BACI|nr:hypothetical protein A6K24_02920 [Metabacillus litoralis]
MSKVTPFLMFQGNAEEAMNYYISCTSPNSVHPLRDSSLKVIGLYDASRKLVPFLCSFTYFFLSVIGIL